MKNTVLFGTLVTCFIIASWFFSLAAMAIAVIFPGPAYIYAMPGLNSHATCENADVATTAKAAAAMKVLDRLVMKGSSRLTWTPADRTPWHQRAPRLRLEMPL